MLGVTLGDKRIGRSEYEKKRYAEDASFRAKCAAAAKKQYQKDVNRSRTLSRQRMLRQMENMKNAVINVLTNGEGTCRWCGQGDQDVLTIDHIDNNGANHRRQMGIGCGKLIYRYLVKNDYPPGFQVLCFNCNNKKEVLRRRAMRMDNTLNG